MKVIIKEITKTKLLLTLTGDEKDLTKIKKHALELLQPKVSASGFREGKVPLNVVEKQLGTEKVQAEVLEEAVNHFYSETLLDKKLRAVDRPKIEVKKYVPFTELEFTAEVETVPPVKLGDYKNLKIKAEPAKVTDKDIDEVIENLRVRSAVKKPVERAAKDEDELIIDFDGKDTKGKPIAGGSGKDYPLRLGSKTFIPGFEEALIGQKAGQDKTFDTTFPKNYGVKTLAGSKVSFRVKVKTVNEVALQQVDNEFAKKLGPFSDVKALRDDIRAQLLSQKMREADDKVKDQILEKLAATSKVILPETLVEDQMRTLEDDFIKNLTYRGLTLKEYLTQEKLEESEFRTKTLRPQAERRVTMGLILSEVAEEEGIKISQDELTLRTNLVKNQYQDETAKAQFDTPEARRDLASRLLTEKTLEKLLTYAA